MNREDVVSNLRKLACWWVEGADMLKDVCAEDIWTLLEEQCVGSSFKCSLPVKCYIFSFIPNCVCLVE